jgi:hypothetical protein
MTALDQPRVLFCCGLGSLEVVVVTSVTLWPQVDQTALKAALDLLEPVHIEIHNASTLLS